MTGRNWMAKMPDIGSGVLPYILPHWLQFWGRLPWSLLSGQNMPSWLFQARWLFGSSSFQSTPLLAPWRTFHWSIKVLWNDCSQTPGSMQCSWFYHHFVWSETLRGNTIRECIDLKVIITYRRFRSTTYKIIDLGKHTLEVNMEGNTNFFDSMEQFQKAIRKVRQVQRMRKQRGYAFSQTDESQARVLQAYDTTKERGRYGEMVSSRK